MLCAKLKQVIVEILALFWNFENWQFSTWFITADFELKKKDLYGQLFCNVELSENLLHNKNLRATGTIKSNRKDLPENFGKEKLNKG